MELVVLDATSIVQGDWRLEDLPGESSLTGAATVGARWSCRKSWFARPLAAFAKPSQQQSKG
jgi:hypothetical protein